MYRTAFINTSSESFLNNIEIKSNFIPTHIVKLRAKKSLLCTIKNIFGKLEELNRAGSFIFFFLHSQWRKRDIINEDRNGLIKEAYIMLPTRNYQNNLQYQEKRNL